VIVAAPVGAPQSVQALRERADEVVCIEMPDDMWAVGLWYEDFRPTSNDEVAGLLADSAGPGSAAQQAEDPNPQSGPLVEELVISLGPQLSLMGDLSAPQRARGIVVFAHGSGSGRLSPRNREVARALNEAGYATLLFDLLRPQEERDRRNVFDIALLSGRLAAATTWLRGRRELEELPLGYFGASTGAAAALTAAAALDSEPRAIVSRGGRPDLALELGAVQAPTLLIVGGADHQVLELNRLAQRELRAPSELAIVPGATHLFEEPGALEQVSRLAIDWFDRYLVSAAAP
jgi:putative phosphoribosyl transferase